MGNAIIEDGVLDKDHDLGKYIKDYMIKNYKLPANDKKYNEFMKKRACCRFTHIVPVSIPSYDQVSKKVYPTQVKIPVFNSRDDINTTNCTFDGNDYSPSNKGDGGGKGYIASDSCIAFYNNMCNDIYDQRSSSYIKPLDKLYGPYPDDPTHGISQPKNLRDIYVGNPFPDCNCLNSIFVRGNVETSGSMDITPEKKAQNFDSRCSGNIPFGGAFVNKWEGPESLNICVNSVNVGGSIVAANDAAANIKQSCSANQTNSNSQVTSQAVKGETASQEQVKQDVSAAGIGNGATTNSNNKSVNIPVGETGSVSVAASNLHPGSTAGSTPNSTIGSTPGSTLGSTPRTTDESTAGSTPRTTAESTAGSTPRTTAESTAGSTPGTTAESSSGSVTDFIKNPKNTLYIGLGIGGLLFFFILLIFLLRRR